MNGVVNSGISRHVTCIVDVKRQPKQVAVVRSLSHAFDQNAVRAMEQ
jgi:hypothetical protein